jgi:hypothetical protein
LGEPNATSSPYRQARTGPKSCMRRGAPVQVMVPFTPQGRVLFIRFPVVAVLAPGARRRRVAPRIALFMKSGVSAGGDRHGQRPPGRDARDARRRGPTGLLP